jgi:hypothetical protein
MSIMRMLKMCSDGVWRGLKDCALSLFPSLSYQPSFTPFRMTSQSSNMVTFERLGMVES